MTFSIVARDEATGTLGVAVASSTLAIGRAAPWALAGVGAAVTQARTNRMYGPAGFDLLGAGHSPAEALKELTGTDPDRDTRQVALVDATGRTAAWTGRGCVSACGHVTGPGYSAQGNTLRSRSVVPCMVEAFLGAEGELAERLVAALAGAQEAGGDLRGRQSAAILVVAGAPSDQPWEDRLVDLRVDDAPEPVTELGRLVTLQRAYEHGDMTVLGERAGGDVPELFAALSAVRGGDREKAKLALEALGRRPGWDGVLRRVRGKLAESRAAGGDPDRN